jgi:hypothetical protein
MRAAGYKLIQSVLLGFMGGCTDIGILFSLQSRMILHFLPIIPAVITTRVGAVEGQGSRDGSLGGEASTGR